MIKTTLALVAAGVLAVSSSFAGGKSCCGAKGTQVSNDSASCMNLASLNLTADSEFEIGGVAE